MIKVYMLLLILLSLYSLLGFIKELGRKKEELPTLYMTASCVWWTVMFAIGAVGMLVIIAWYIINTGILMMDVI